MEGSEKKRKRGEIGELKGRDRRKKEVGEPVTGKEDEAEAMTVEAQPSEEEVEEFFTILRRMHVAVKYFEKTGTNISDVNGGGGISNVTALEQSGAVDVDGVKIDEQKKSLVVGGLDLNAVPEAES